MKRALGVVLAVFSTCAAVPAFAGEVVFQGLSQHFRNSDQVNNLNFGLGYGFDRSIIDRVIGKETGGHDIVGCYHNSRSHFSCYAGYYHEFHTVSSGPLRHLELGGMIGAVTGYKYAPIMPAGLFMASYPIGILWGDKHTILHFSLVPTKSGPATLSIGYRW